ncbi:mucin-20-like isoform X2 [Palaemon carinicauda]|uniref:mucin-20-like isoform X2 n=1 Tax=Palaemon carinicauda TaxID=392227 RepID=UPI0035B66CE1
MMLLALVLVVGTTVPTMTSAMPQELPPLVNTGAKTLIINRLCIGSPSTRSQCITEVEDCMDLLQMDPTAEEMPETDLERICNGTESISECTARVTKCSKLFAEKSSDEPQSLTSLDSLPTKENLEVMCVFMKMENCTQTFEDCFELIGPAANITGFPTREMFECSNIFDTYIEATKNISGAPGPNVGPVDDTDEEGPAPTKEMMEAMCQATEIPNCLERVQECFLLIGPGSPAPSTPTGEMAECSIFLSQFADTAANSTETTEGSVNTTTRAPVVTREMMETMCNSSDERNCVQRMEECLSLIGPGANVPRTLSREMTECSRFLDNFSEAMDNITATTEITTTSTAVPDSDVTGTTSRTTTDRSSSTGNRRESSSTTTTESSVRTSTTTERTRTRTTTTTTQQPGQNTAESNSTVPAREYIEGVCEFVEVPNCAQRVEECFMMRENNNASRTEAQNCSEVLTSYEDINRNLTDYITGERPVCENESCRRCETLIRPTRSYNLSLEECRTNTEQTLRECMKPVMERHLNQVGRPDIRRQIIAFFNSCYPENSYGGINRCVIEKCTDII